MKRQRQDDIEFIEIDGEWTVLYNRRMYSIDIDKETFIQLISNDSENNISIFNGDNGVFIEINNLRLKSSSVYNLKEIL